MGLATLVRTVASLGLPSGLRTPSRPLDTDSWNRLVPLLSDLCLLAPLAEAIGAGRWPASPKQARDLTRRHEALVTRDVLLERHLLACVGALAERDIVPLVLKGRAIAHHLYGDPGRRSSRDVDLLVPPSTLPEAIEALEAAGTTRRFPEPVPGFDARFSKGAAMVFGDGSEIDLHRTLAQGPFGVLVDPWLLFDGAVTVDIGGHVIRFPSLEATGAHLCLHAVLGQPVPRANQLRDVAMLAFHTGLDTERLLALAAEWEAEAVIAYAVGTACTELDLAADISPLACWSRDFRPRTRDLQRLRPYLGHTRRGATMTLGALREIHGLEDRLRYTRAVALPRRAHRSTTDRLARGWRALGVR